MSFVPLRCSSWYVYVSHTHTNTHVVGTCKHLNANRRTYIRIFLGRTEQAIFFTSYCAYLCNTNKNTNTHTRIHTHILEHFCVYHLQHSNMRRERQKEFMGYHRPHLLHILQLKLQTKICVNLPLLFQKATSHSERSLTFGYQLWRNTQFGRLETIKSGRE